MTYTEAIKKSFTVKWKVDTCPQGEQCWCRIIRCEEPLMYEDEDEYWPIRAGEVEKDTVEHIVKLHNEAILSITVA